MKKSIIIVIVPVLAACAAQTLKPGAGNIELVNEAPNESKCKYISEIVGSQGNWFTGDFTSNKNLVIGARNEIRNKAYDLGANVVYIQDMTNTNAWGSTGTTNTTVVGKVYKCSR